jgi:hypothetical protein
MRNDGGWKDGKMVGFRFIFNLAAILEKLNSVSVKVFNLCTNSSLTVLLRHLFGATKYLTVHQWPLGANSIVPPIYRNRCYEASIQSTSSIQPKRFLAH